MLSPLARALIAMLAASLAYAVDSPSLLTIQVAEGDRAVYPTGSRATRGITVLVTDETGHPVEGATVSFTLPAEGPGGVFSSGSRTEIASTRSDGRAGVWGMRWNRTAGPFEMRLTAVKGQARAGAISSQTLNNASEARDAGSGKLGPGELHHGLGSHKLLWIGLAVAGAAGAAVAGAAGMAGGKQGSTAAVVVTPLQIGTPTISLGHP